MLIRKLGKSNSRRKLCVLSLLLSTGLLSGPVMSQDASEKSKRCIFGNLCGKTVTFGWGSDVSKVYFANNGDVFWDEYSKGRGYICSPSGASVRQTCPMSEHPIKCSDGEGIIMADME